MVAESIAASGPRDSAKAASARPVAQIRERRGGPQPADVAPLAAPPAFRHPYVSGRQLLRAALLTLAALVSLEFQWRHSAKAESPVLSGRSSVSDRR